MPPYLTTAKPFKCSYADCNLFFESEEAMQSHKKHSDEHDYCHKCDEDFEDYPSYAQHKAFRPDKHHKACRVCGEEFKSSSGLRRHIELNHFVDQKLSCIGCGKRFYRAALLIEHIELSDCRVISAQQFMGHIVHKHLITEILKGELTHERFMMKISNYDASQDSDPEGGINLGSMACGNEKDGGQTHQPDTKVLEPDCKTQKRLALKENFPPLPSQQRSSQASNSSTLVSTMNRMSLTPTLYKDANGDAGATGYGMTCSNHQVKPWSGRSSRKLFREPASPSQAKEVSQTQHDQRMCQDYGINILRVRFWDPLHPDWNPERFYNGVLQRYHCPFPCEQTHETPGELNTHILVAHRIPDTKCPCCQKRFTSITGLIAHCESRNLKCRITEARNFCLVLDKYTGGFLAVKERVHPDFKNNPAVLVENADTGELEKYTPPVAVYLQFEATKPVDWVEPTKVAKEVGGEGRGAAFRYKGGLAKW